MIAILRSMLRWKKSFLVENESDMRFISSLRPQQLVFLDGILIEIQINFH